ncbi:uncharacterized protein EV420DRAFT_1502154 [Desarmillaria tabescens]|uniref:Uncharacterized protein n=1 Tax=Armillaria tabescens TaxID=1929756 RepID=A0AA39NLR6_ARMTA|nr:uncharacterized protein EV420DRAFT_1502154 [Desarmillaria tabescens]KAK0467972.1 hypothetical protein EV420DRAFT_1502154 [Desarmillaria tabescens]
MAEFLDPQLRLLTSLNFTPRGRRNITTFLRTNDYVIDEESTKALLFLNWISRSFVRDAGGDSNCDQVSVAASLTMDSYTLYIATSRGVADETDHEYSDQFLAVFHEIFDAQKYLLAAGQQVVAYQDAIKVMNCIVDRVWKRFLKKIAVLRERFLANGGFEKLDGLVRAWLSWRATKKKGGERSADIIALSPHYTDGDNHAMFRKVFEVILDEEYATQSYQSRELRVEYFIGITSLSRALFKSSFFRDGCRRDFPEAKSSYFFRQTVRRLWRVQFYYSGALYFVGPWMKSCRSAFATHGGSFCSILWVGRTLPKTVTFPTSLRETLASILRRQSVKFSENDLDMWFEARSMPIVDSAWKEGRPRILRPHPEIQIMNFLRGSDISVIGNTVGSSKRMCEVCALYAEVYEEISSCAVSFVFTPRYVPSTKVTIDNDWMLPAPSENVTFQNEMNAVVDRVINKFSSEADRLFATKFFNHVHPNSSMEPWRYRERLSQNY